jgi:trehalose 6-phosphate phosphatase
MKYVFKDISNIKNRLKKHNFVLLLDFDLTLSPLAKNPEHAFLPKTTKDNLKRITSLIPVVIITGRKLSDIKKRINVKNILYVGNHGLEHNLNKKYAVIALSIATKKALLKAKQKLFKICRTYPEIIFEDKKYAFALGYRLVRKDKIDSLESIFRKIQKDINQESLLETRLEKKTFELRPRIKVDKGTACLLALKITQTKLHKKLIPIYIGDSQTDEDAFVVLKKDGITIRVGKNNKSSAKWYLKNQKEVSLFLKRLLSFMN